ncbi:MAG: LysR family transcriptional regulator [Acidithiobacillus sp.]
MWREIGYFYQVYLEGSFSKAAEKLYLTQPALSIAIQKLEAAAGMPLFDRSTRPLTLTPAGEIYVDTIKKAMCLEQELKQQLEDKRQLKSGNIRIGGSHYLNAYILPEIIKSFSEKYPLIHLELLEHSSAQLSRMLVERELDITFNCNPKFLMDFDRYAAFDDQILLAVPKSYPVNQTHIGAAMCAADIRSGAYLSPSCPIVSLQDFRELEFILLTKNNNLYDRSHALFDMAGFEPKIKLELSQLVTAYHLADHGLAATFVSDRLVTAQEDNLNYYKLDSELIVRHFYILLPKRSYTSFAIRAFITHFQECMKQGGDIKVGGILSFDRSGESQID